MSSILYPPELYQILGDPGAELWPRFNWDAFSKLMGRNSSLSSHQVVYAGTMPGSVFQVGKQMLNILAKIKHEMSYEHSIMLAPALAIIVSSTGDPSSFRTWEEIPVVYWWAQNALSNMIIEGLKETKSQYEFRVTEYVVLPIPSGIDTYQQLPIPDGIDTYQQATCWVLVPKDSRSRPALDVTVYKDI